VQQVAQSHIVVDDQNLGSFFRHAICLVSPRPAAGASFTRPSAGASFTRPSAGASFTRPAAGASLTAGNRADEPIFRKCPRRRGIGRANGKALYRRLARYRRIRASCARGASML
jgi:hypothetical protein